MTTLSASRNNAEGISGVSKWNGEHDSASQAQRGDMRRARILVAERSAFVREGIASLIDGQPDLCCCGDADSIASILAAINKSKPDLVVTELRFKDGDAFELMNTLSLGRSKPPILVLSQCDEVVYAERALEAGAGGYVMKVEAVEQLLDAVRSVLRGRVYLSPAMNARLVQRVLKPGLKVKEQDTQSRI